eukprot:CAMPEP_0201549528 /NCGR_PEP_ID=MMETSP0173_2-20130828/5990_1 /ASSEMBLY_ACC=CAM_ASM_000268 /TAXON_ID=218659 /ORGANISM="Vexillifera sp., Strain DIVA3 564/2" /LENGTH=717 /DNA_ID=CAMNT_0047959223 /DNA_START=1 /DNA_END=2151 /DNA_ORIENTATION=+
MGLAMGRSYYKLFLEASLILTSVIPPELPIELSLAVNASLAALLRKGVFCTEPFRIPFAGRVDVACFDKTGTLTTDRLVLLGIGGLCMVNNNTTNSEKDKFALEKPSASPLETMFVIAGCQSLINTSKTQLIGDSMELISLQSIPFQQKPSGHIINTTRAQKTCIEIVHRFPFTSSLKRMTCVVELRHERKGDKCAFMVLSKGAPEIMVEYLANVHPNYEEIYSHVALAGSRVLSLCYKRLPASINSVDAVRALCRQEIESDLQFGGFLVFSCPMKSSSEPVLADLHASSHRTVMITGDHILTACHAAHKLGITTKPMLLIERADDNEQSVTFSRRIGGQCEFTLSPTTPASEVRDRINQLRAHYDFAMSGKALETLSNPKQYASSLRARMVRLVEVFARVAPDQKELITLTLNQGGLTTLMCGDGTNDVGALKQAHIGVSLVTSSVAKKVAAADKKKKQTNKSNLRRRKPRSAAEVRSQMSKMMKEANEQDSTMVKLGDASIAAPFSTKSTSITPVLNILRQGRCTLVTTYQMFTILALNSLISAYSLSVLYLAGVKYGDAQMTVMGMLITLCFLFISQSKPLQQLSKETPPRRLFSLRLFISLFVQFGVHMACLMYTVSLAEQYTQPSDEPVDLDADFAPNLLNTGVFFISTTMQVATFIANYQGHPFMESFSENKKFSYAILFTGGVLALLAIEIIPDLNEYLELVPMPSGFKW